MYGTLEGWRAYATARGDNAPTAASDVDATAALTRASDMIQYRYVANLLPGYDETLPVVESATYVAASFELATPNLFSTTYTADERKVLTGVDTIRWTVIGNGKGAFGSMATSTLIDAMFFPYIASRDGPFFGLKAIGGGC